VRHPQKRGFDLWIPLVITTGLVVLAAVLPSPVRFVAEKGVIEQVNELLQVLVGFYIAALAAVATYTHPSLNQKFAGAAAVLPQRIKGSDDKGKELTRRQFLSMMFAYLALLSLILYFSGILVSTFSPLLSHIPSILGRSIVRSIVMIVYTFGCAQLVVITLLGLYYLGDRLHRANPTLMPRNRKNGQHNGGNGDGPTVPGD